MQKKRGRPCTIDHVTIASDYLIRCLPARKVAILHRISERSVFHAVNRVLAMRDDPQALTIQRLVGIRNQGV